MTDTTATDRAREALEGITPGEWSINEDDPDAIAVEVQRGDYPVWVHSHDIGFRDDTDAQIIANARFIAAAPQLVRDLLAENEALRAQARAAEVRGMRRAVEMCDAVIASGGNGPAIRKAIIAAADELEAQNAADALEQGGSR